MRATAILALCILLSGCDGDAPEEDAGRRDGGVDGGPAPACSLTSPFDGTPTEGGLEVGELEDDVFSSWDDDPNARYEWGFQGGTMILPVIGIPVATAGDERCFEVTLRHRPDPDAPEAFGDVGDFPEVTLPARGAVEGDVVWLEPIQDQIGNVGLDGVRLELEVTVRGVAFAATHAVRITIGSDIPEMCLALELWGEGCVYRRVAGTATVTAVEAVDPADGPNCPDARRVTFDFAPTDAAVAACWEDRHGDAMPGTLRVGDYYWDPPATCLGGVVIGSELPVNLLYIEGGPCAPFLYETVIEACEAACPQ